MTHNHAEYPVEDPVESPAAQAMIHDIVQVRNRSELRKLGGAHLGRMLISKQITPAEHQILSDELVARRKSLTMSSGIEPPMELPHDPALPGHPWSPTSVLDKMSPSPREFDARERAAGEHLDR